jgi:hypothetical protein
LTFISLLFVILIAINHYAPKPLNWRETYEFTGKSPYGCYILNDMSRVLFPGQKVSDSQDCFYVSLDSGSVKGENLISITSNFNPDKFDLDALLKYVARGNDFFVSSGSFGELFTDRLKIKLASPMIDTSLYLSGKETLFLLNPELRNDSGFHYDKKMQSVWISAYDTLNTVKLGTNRDGDVNFICMKYGLGKIYFHTQPQVFTNYHLLSGNIEYASKVLSYLPIRKTVWDNYYKPYRFINQSPMRYVLSQPPLQSAYYLMLLTLLLYFVVESKRRQRVIPVLKPLVNRSLQFVKTIGSLYFNQKNNTDLARKKIIYFKEFLRERYYLSTISLTEEYAVLVSKKSGLPIDMVQSLFEIMELYQTTPAVSDHGLIDLNRRMELFYKQCF